MFENIEERNKLVDKLVDKVTNDYNSFMDALLTTRDIEQMAFRTTVLTWVKHNIIDESNLAYAEKPKERDINEKQRTANENGID